MNKGGSTTTVAFRSKPKQQQQQQAQKKRNEPAPSREGAGTATKRRGPNGQRSAASSFPFFRLPPELRSEILSIAIAIAGDLDSRHRVRRRRRGRRSGGGGGGDVLSLFLTSARMYREAASIFYQDVRVSLEDANGRGGGGGSGSSSCGSGSSSGSGSGADPFLVVGDPGARNVLAPPRRLVRCLTIAFLLPPGNHVHLLRERYGPALRDMVENGELERLRLEVGSRFPAADFWGGGYGYGDSDGNGDGDDDDEEEVRVLLGGKREGAEIRAPRFVTRAPFQGFLALLGELPVPRLALYVDARDHGGFWCAFHRPRPSGARCDGAWGGRRKLLKIRWRDAVDVLGGARVAAAPTT